jgi:hypothetical protein
MIKPLALFNNRAQFSAKIEDYASQICNLKSFQTSAIRGMTPVIHLIEVGGSDVDSSLLHGNCVLKSPEEAAEEIFQVVKEALLLFKATILQVNCKAIIIPMPIIFQTRFKHRYCKNECFATLQSKIHVLTTGFSKKAFIPSDIAWYCLKTVKKGNQVISRKVLKTKGKYRRSAFRNDRFLSPWTYRKLRALISRAAITLQGHFPLG